MHACICQTDHFDFINAFSTIRMRKLKVNFTNFVPILLIPHLFNVESHFCSFQSSRILAIFLKTDLQKPDHRKSPYKSTLIQAIQYLRVLVNIPDAHEIGHPLPLAFRYFLCSHQ